MTTDDYPEYDFERAAMLLGLYVTINKEGISQLSPIANAAFEELKQMIADQQPRDEPGLLAEAETEEDEDTDPTQPRSIPSTPPARRS